MVEGIFHVGVTVTNLERSIQFYEQMLGMELSISPGPTPPMSGEEFSNKIGVPGSELRLAVLKAGSDELELMEFLAPHPASTEPMMRNVIGAAHVAFKVSGLDAQVEAMKKKGVQFLGDVHTETEGSTAGWRWVFFRDPDGIIVELSGKD